MWAVTNYNVYLFMELIQWHIKLFFNLRKRAQSTKKKMRKMILSEKEAQVIHHLFDNGNPGKAINLLNKHFNTNVSSESVDTLFDYMKEIKPIGAIELTSHFNDIAFSKSNPKKVNELNISLPRNLMRCVKVTSNTGNEYVGLMSDHINGGKYSLTRTKDNKTFHFRSKEIRSIVHGPTDGKSNTFKKCGHRRWSIMHSSIENITSNDTLTTNEYNEIKAVVKNIGFTVERKSCREHFREIWKRHPFTKSHKKRVIANHICDLHNIVNKRIGKPMFDYNLLESSYKTIGS